MRKHATYAAVAAMAVGSFAFVGCERDDTTTTSRTTTTTPPNTSPSTGPAVSVDVDTDRARNAADRAGDAIHRGAERTGEVLANAADKTKDVARDVGGKINDAAHRTGEAANRAVDRAANRTENAADDAQQAASRGTPGAPDAEGIRDVLAQVTEAALTKGGLDDMVERFVDADRNRLGQGNALDANNQTLDGRIDQFRKDWKAKYGQDFDINNEEAAFPQQSFMIAQGEIPRGAAGAEVDVNRRPDGTVKVDVDNRSGVDNPASPAADTNRNDPGRNVAQVRVAASQGMPDLQVPMIHEAPDRWKIDVPDTLTADKLRQNVLDHLTAADNPAQWPADVNQAYAQVARHVLMAVLDKPAK